MSEPTLLPWTVRLAERLRRVVDFIGRWAAWLSIPVVLVTCMDVIFRKLAWEDAEGNIYSVQTWFAVMLGGMFDSTILQELEWHFHTGLFALVLGYGVVYNTHVRIDLIRDHVHFRGKAWLEFFGLTLFMLPYCAVVIYFALDYAHSSYVVKEVSASTVGLSHRWIIKSVLVAGMVVAMISGIAAWLQVVTILWGARELRFPLMTLDWPEEDSRIEGKTRVRLEDDYGLQLSNAPGTAPPASGAKAQRPAAPQAAE